MNITKLSEKFVYERPYIKKALANGLVNYSSLTRMISKENNLDLKKNFDAVLIALRRYKKKITKGKVIDYSNLLKKAKLEMKKIGSGAEILIKVEKSVSSLCGYVYSLLDENEIKFKGQNSLKEIKIFVNEKDLSKVVKILTG